MADLDPDPPSPLARRMIDAGTYEALVAPSRAPQTAHDLLDGVAPERLLAVPAARPAAAHALLAALWLRHDGLHECHEIVQRSPDDRRFSAPARPAGNDEAGKGFPLRELTATFSYWHAVMHRREGDFGNAKYWYAKCAGHPAHARVAALAGPVLAGSEAAARAAARLTRGGWDADAFVDLVEAAAERPADHADHRLAVALQRAEWQALFNETVRQAVGG